MEACFEIGACQSFPHCCPDPCLCVSECCMHQQTNLKIFTHISLPAGIAMEYLWPPKETAPKRCWMWNVSTHFSKSPYWMNFSTWRWRWYPGKTWQRGMNDISGCCPPCLRLVMQLTSSCLYSCLHPGQLTIRVIIDLDDILTPALVKYKISEW